MIGISKLYLGLEEIGDATRHSAAAAASAKAYTPSVVWNCTQRCNLKCAGCYVGATDRAAPKELTTRQAKAMINDLAGMGAPSLVFAGGEPLLRADVVELVAHARGAGLQAVLATNGTLIGLDLARRLAVAGLSFAAVSLDGTGGVNDALRGVNGAFEAAMRGVRNCQAVGLKVGLRLTMNRRNVGQIPGIFELLRRERVGQVCFHHLVSVGRGGQLQAEMLSRDQARQAVDAIIDGAAAAHAAGQALRVFTADNHADGPYVYLRMRKENSPRAAAAFKLLKAGGGDSCGSGVGCVSWNGDVLPDPFWRQHVLGNVRERPLSEIWGKGAKGLLAQLRHRKKHLKCRCGQCRWMSVCNGNSRVRAQAAGDPWGDDPACYLTDDEIAT
jgi:radical SAM protein with 4Fe4S-binding SPASM domain